MCCVCNLGRQQWLLCWLSCRKFKNKLKGCLLPRKECTPEKELSSWEAPRLVYDFFFNLRKQGGKWKGEQTCHQATRRTRALYLQIHSLCIHGTRKPGSMIVTSSNRHHLRQKELLRKRQFSQSCFLPECCCSFPTPAPTLQQLLSMANGNHLVQRFISVPFRMLNIVTCNL